MKLYPQVQGKDDSMKRMLKKNNVGSNSSKANGLNGMNPPGANGVPSKGSTRPSSGTKKPLSNPGRPGLPQSNSAQGHYDSSSQQ